jgi:hypothetical protein
LLADEIAEELFSFANLRAILSFAPAVMIITLPVHCCQTGYTKKRWTKIPTALNINRMLHQDLGQRSRYSPKLWAGRPRNRVSIPGKCKRSLFFLMRPPSLL